MTDPAAGRSPALTYGAYLALDEVLGAQRPRSDEHDELLFIVIHQVYELWFKQLLHEAAHLQRRLEDGDTSHALHTLRRVLTILKVAVAQIDVLETMTPRQFLGFRDRLDAASGFQSAQFRELEAVLGRRDADVVDHYPDGDDRRRLAAAMVRPSLFDSFLRYLAGEGYDVPRGRPRAGRRAARRARRRRSGGRCWRCTATTAARRRSPSASSTWTRACRSGATAT